MRIAVIVVSTMFLAPAVFAKSGTQPWYEKTAAIGAVSTMPSGPIGKLEMERLRKIGEALFTAKFTVHDGIGRPDATQAALPTKVRHRSPGAFSRQERYGLDVLIP